jgi:hypothetical protein
MLSQIVDHGIGTDDRLLCHALQPIRQKKKLASSGREARL